LEEKVKMTIGYPIKARSKESATKKIKEILDTGPYTYKILKVDVVPRKLYNDEDKQMKGLRWYTVTYIHGSRKSFAEYKPKKHTYELKFPHEGASWQKVVATSANAARRKFVKGSRYTASQVKIRWLE
jgi:hypothetical protein